MLSGEFVKVQQHTTRRVRGRHVKEIVNGGISTHDEELVKVSRERRKKQ